MKEDLDVYQWQHEQASLSLTIAKMADDENLYNTNKEMKDALERVIMKVKEGEV